MPAALDELKSLNFNERNSGAMEPVSSTTLPSHSRSLLNVHATISGLPVIGSSQRCSAAQGLELIYYRTIYHNVYWLQYIMLVTTASINTLYVQYQHIFNISSKYCCPYFQISARSPNPIVSDRSFIAPSVTCYIIAFNQMISINATTTTESAANVPPQSRAIWHLFYGKTYFNDIKNQEMQIRCVT